MTIIRRLHVAARLLTLGLVAAALFGSVQTASAQTLCQTPPCGQLMLQPDPDLVIRTSGETRISNFLLWQLAYSELVFPEVLWPDFRREHLFDAVREYQQRQRRYGGVT